MPTMNAVPSSDPSDLLFNAQRLDEVINGSAESFVDRRGVERLTLTGALRLIGFEAPVAFASGLAITRSTQTVTNGGNTYHADPASLPFTSTSTFNGAQWRLVSNVTSFDLAAYAVPLVGGAGTIEMAKLTTPVQNLINGALQRAGGTMLADIILAGNTAQDLGAVPKQQAESIAAAAGAAAAASAVANRFQFSQTLEIATTSGSAIDINDLPAWTKRLTVTFGGSSITTTGAIGIQLGTTSGFEASGYSCIHVGIVSGSYSFGSTTGVIFRTDISGGANLLFATVVMDLHGSNRWQAAASGYRAGDGALALSYGQIQLPADLTRLRLSTSQPFDGGSVSVLCEG